MGQYNESSLGNLISFAIEKDYNMISNYFLQFEKELPVYALEARNIWLSSMKIIDNVQSSLEIPFLLRERLKMYALDGVIVAHSLNIPQEQRFNGLKAFSLSYLASHLFDDYVEDFDKYRSKYSIPSIYSGEVLIRSMGLSAPLLTLLSIIHALDYEENSLDYKDQVGLLKVCMESLVKQVNIFLHEGVSTVEPESVLINKHRGVAAEATSLMYDFLQISKFVKSEESGHLKKALWYLGSLTQFTDDIRDYTIDKEKRSPNLLISLEKDFGKNSINEFIKLYLLEDIRMCQEIAASNLPIDINFWRLIPWHPFLVKPNE